MPRSTLDPLSSETTAIAPSTHRTRSYDATVTTPSASVSTSGRDSPVNGHQSIARDQGNRNSNTNTTNNNDNNYNNNSNQGSETRRTDNEDESGESHKMGLLAKLGSIELENKGSVARDHLALERTFLAWLRTSLAFASIGIAITQLFRLSSGSSSDSSGTNARTLHALGKPLGATFLAIAILVLIIGINRYYESQAWLLRGKFPASRGSVLLLTVVAAALIISSLVIILVVGPGFSER